MTGGPVLLDSASRGPRPGPVTVLLHSLGLDRRVWEPSVDAFSRLSHIVLLDLRGHGRSPKSDVFSIEDMADDVAHTVADLGHEQVVVVGMSLGGCVAQALAVRHPDLVRGLGLVDTTAWYGQTAPEDWAARAGVAADKGLSSLAEFQLTRWFSDGFRAQHPEECGGLLDSFVANDLASYQAACKALGDFDARRTISEIAVPTAIVVGEFDEATPPAMAEDLRSRIAGARLTVIAGSKHLTAYERPTEVFEALAPLLRERFSQS